MSSLDAVVEVPGNNRPYADDIPPSRLGAMACLEPGAIVEEMRAWARRREDEIEQLFRRRPTR